VATGFMGGIVQITNAQDGSNRLFVVEKIGKIKIIKDGITLPTPFLDITSLVSDGNEQGLLGVAFPTDFAAKGYFYVDFTDRNKSIRVARFSIGANPDVVDIQTITSIIEIPKRSVSHNGGQIDFGTDGYLYISTGDDGPNGGDPFHNAQDTSSLLGKILRIDVESGVIPYSIPVDNPFNNEVWAYGLRNPWRFSFDRITKEIYIADVGESTREEVNVMPASSAGVNYGWPIMEGSICFNSPTCMTSGLTIPVAEYGHIGGDCSVSGGRVYRGTEYPTLYGVYFYSDFCSGRIRGIRRSGATWEGGLLLDTNHNITNFGEDEQGNMYFSDAYTGQIFKVTL
jgi:glucose/arabinose dehydrogenase